MLNMRQNLVFNAKSCIKTMKKYIYTHREYKRTVKKKKKMKKGEKKFEIKSHVLQFGKLCLSV